LLSERIPSGKFIILNPWPLSYAPVIDIADSVSIVQKNISL
jgi:hypothetical protein